MTRHFQVTFLLQNKLHVAIPQIKTAKEQKNAFQIGLQIKVITKQLYYHQNTGNITMQNNIRIYTTTVQKCYISLHFQTITL